MIAVSDAWKEVQYRYLLPETFVEIDCAISEIDIQDGASVIGTGEAAFSDAESIIEDTPKYTKYATNELNLWALNGTRVILPSATSHNAIGYVSNIASTGSVTLSFDEVHTVASPGLTITWSNLYSEYPRVFTVTAKNGETVVAETTVTDNKDQVSVLFLTLQNYDSISITVHDWNKPNRRARIENVLVGHVLTLTKNDIISFKHEQHGDILSGEIPKNSIEFSLNNFDGRWNPNNPTGMEQYLSERQKLIVRYGLDVNGTVEWIKAGTFYLSEWDAPSNGYEARFVARDSLEFMLGVDAREKIEGTLKGIIEQAVPDDVAIEVSESLNEYSTSYSPETAGSLSVAELVQLCANAGRCVIRYDREGVLYVEPLKTDSSGYVVAQALSFNHPEITLSKPLKAVSVELGEESPLVMEFSQTGETQSINNALINPTVSNNEYLVDEAQAVSLGRWVGQTLLSRKTVSGEYRADPRLDLFDVVEVQGKYGSLFPVVITNITYTYNGSFRGNYTGRILEVF